MHVRERFSPSIAFDNQQLERNCWHSVVIFSSLWSVCRMTVNKQVDIDLTWSINFQQEINKEKNSSARREPRKIICVVI